MGAALPKGWSRCDVHDVQWYGLAACPDCVGAYSYVACDVDEPIEEPVRCAMYFPSVGVDFVPDLTTTKFHMVMAGGYCGDAACTKCDPMERMVDGLSVRECLARYSIMQRVDGYGAADYARAREFYQLTPLQKEAARSAWSSSLRAKQAEVKERDRLSVRCDEQWGEDV
jgi:hypothetical protein